MLKFVKDNFVFTNKNDDFLLFKDIKDMYRSNREYDQSKLKDIKKHLEKTMNTVIYERKKINNTNYRSVIVGWSIIEGDEEA